MQAWRQTIIGQYSKDIVKYLKGAISQHITKNSKGKNIVDMDTVIANLHNDIYFIKIYQEIYERFDKDVDKAQDIFKTVIEDCIKKSKNSAIKRFLRNLPSPLEILMRIACNLLSVIIFFLKIVASIKNYSKNKLYNKMNSLFKENKIGESAMKLVEELGSANIDGLLQNASVKSLILDIDQKFNIIGYDNILKLMNFEYSEDKSQNKEELEFLKNFIANFETQSEKNPSGVDVEKLQKNTNKILDVIDKVEKFDPKDLKAIQCVKKIKNQIKEDISSKSDQRDKNRLIDKSLNDKINPDLLNPIKDGLNEKIIKKANDIQKESYEQGEFVREFKNPSDEDAKNPTFHFKTITELAEEKIKKTKTKQ